MLDEIRQPGFNMLIVWFLFVIVIQYVTVLLTNLFYYLGLRGILDPFELSVIV